MAKETRVANLSFIGLKSKTRMQHPDYLYPDKYKEALEKLHDWSDGDTMSLFWQSFIINEAAITCDIERECVEDARKRFYDALGRLAVSLTEKVQTKSDAIEVAYAVEDIVHAVRFLAHFEDEIFEIDHPHQEANRSNAKKMRDALREKQRPQIERRKELLRKANFNLEEIAASRKFADAAAKSFAALCEQEGIAPVSGKQLQRDARDILEERREKPGHS